MERSVISGHLALDYVHCTAFLNSLQGIRGRFKVLQLTVSHVFNRKFDYKLLYFEFDKKSQPMEVYRNTLKFIINLG